MAPLAKMTTNGNFGSRIDDLTTVINGENCQPCQFWPQMAKNGNFGSKIDDLTTVINGKKCEPCQFWPKMAKNGRGSLRR